MYKRSSDDLYLDRCVAMTLAQLPYAYVSLRLRVQNAVSAQPCVGKLGISLVLLNFLDCNLDCGLKLHKLLIHTLVMLQK